MPAARLGLGLGLGQAVYVAQPDIVDDDPGVVLRAPFANESLVEPGLKARDKILPAHNSQGFLRRLRRARNDRWRQPGEHGGSQQ